MPEASLMKNLIERWNSWPESILEAAAAPQSRSTEVCQRFRKSRSALVGSTVPGAGAVAASGSAPETAVRLAPGCLRRWCR